MNPATIIEQTAREGVVLSLSASGNIRAKGRPERIEKWRATILESRGRLIELLSGSADDDTLGNNTSFSWRINFANRDPLAVTFSPEATYAEVQASYPAVVSIETVTPQPERPANRSEATELRQLVTMIYRDDGEPYLSEALDAALAGPESALLCYRAIALEHALDLQHDQVLN